MNVRMLVKYWRTILVVAEMNIRQQMTDGFILFTMLSSPNHPVSLTKSLERLLHTRLNNFSSEMHIEESLGAIRITPFLIPFVLITCFKLLETLSEAYG